MKGAVNMERQALPYIHDVSRCLATTIGEGGVAQAEIDALLPKAGEALVKLRTVYEDNSLPLLRLPERTDDIEECANALQGFVRGAETVYILGTGGSSLGGQALVQLHGYRVPGVLPSSTPGTVFMDNLDGNTMAQYLRDCDLRQARFIVISKSGGTPETISQLIAIIEALKEEGLEWNIGGHILGVSEPGSSDKNALRRLAERYAITVLDHDPNIGGRFSVLSNVGILPALIMGLDVHALRAGAHEVLQPILDNVTPEASAPALGAVINHCLAQNHGHTASVIMPYTDRLRLFSAWFGQLWAESLGKEGMGTAPIAAAGPVDQHSLFQLFNGGPKDKLVNFIMTRAAGKGPRIPDSYASDPLVGYLAGHTIGDLVDCEQRASAETLAKNGRPVRIFSIDKLNEHSLGGLLMHFMLETIITGHLMGVDPFDQPAVEDSKVLTREYLKTM
ncbi:MAG: glucose-6-phosphate isomerase [Hyphomicrobiales bacterium]